MIYPTNFEQKIGFDKIRQKLTNHTISDLGDHLVNELAFMTDFSQIETAILQTNEFKEICLFEDDFPTSYYINATIYFDKIKIEGTYLTQIELFDLKRSMETIRAILSFFANAEEGKYPNLQKLTEDITIYSDVFKEINRIIDKLGQIKDNASPELHRIRREFLQKQSAASRSMHRMLKQAQKDGWIDAETTLSVRDGKMLIPVPVAYKRKIKGFVHDESATGKTVFIEPVEIVETNNVLRELEFAERREIIKVLRAFSDAIRPYLTDLYSAYLFMGMIDFTRAKALLSIDLEAVKPSLVDSPQIDFYRARHPLLFLSHKAEKKQVVPLDLSLDAENRILLISGPNAGGKSVCLKTIGLLQYMLQCGLLVSANDTSVFGIFDRLFIDIGDEQSIENDLSTYSSHLKNMRHFTENANNRTLILIDEFGTGTEPLLGGSISEAVLEQLNEQQTFGVITTHYTNLKHFATASKGIVNGAMLFDSNKMRPLFKLKIGQPGSSFAFEIAQEIGLSKRILDSAVDKIGREHVDFDKNLKIMEQEQRDLREQEKRLTDKEIHLNKVIDKYQNKLDNSLKKQKEILEQAHSDAKEILQASNKKIENTIFLIKTNNAEKDRTGEARKKLEEFKTEIDEKNKKESTRIDAKIKKIEDRRKYKKKKLNKEEEPKPEKMSPIEVGDHVRILKQKTIGEVVEIKKNKLTLAIGSMHTTVKKDDVEKISKNESKKESRSVRVVSDWKPEKTRGDFIFSLDVRGQRGDAALQKVTTYLDEAIVAEASEIKILHGKGTGILRQMIREYLATVVFVQSYKDEKVENGGAGITVVKLD